MEIAIYTLLGMVALCSIIVIATVYIVGKEYDEAHKDTEDPWNYK